MKTYTMNLTEKERNVINAMRESNGIDNDTTDREEMIEHYMDMDMEEFAEAYEDIFGFNHMMEKFKDALLNWYSKDELLMTLEPHVTEDDIVNYIVDNIDVEFLKLMFVEAVGQESLAEELIDSDNRIFNSSSP
jgi:hypothetical protein